MEATATLNRRQRRSAMKNSKNSHNNRKNNQRSIQIVYSEKPKVFIGKYITDHMLEKAIHAGMTKKQALEAYGKNRYRVNPSAKALKIITHKLYIKQY